MDWAIRLGPWGGNAVLNGIPVSVTTTAGTLITLATRWLDHPDTPRRIPVDAVSRLCHGLIATVR